MPEQIKKITIGFVVQTFDVEKNAWIAQEFIAGDQVDWEDENGESLDDGDYETAANNYLPMDMTQPEEN